MRIREYEFYHGAALLKVLQAFENGAEIRVRDDISRGCYVINGIAGLFIKHSASRMPPWSFTFLDEHREAVRRLIAEYSAAHVVLVCNDDGMVVVAAGILFDLLGGPGTAWIRVDRRRRGMYMVTGPGGDLDHRLADADFASVVALVGSPDTAGATRPAAREV